MDIERTGRDEESFKDASERLCDLLTIIRRLRSPDGGCPWDIRQRKEDIGRYLLEEAYEVIESIEEGTPVHQCEEMGDLLFQILFLARISEERGEFDISLVMKEIAEKMVRRHPHVFQGEKVETVGEVKANWERIKLEVEHKEKAAGFLSGIPRALPALVRARRVTEKAAEVGFDWRHIEEVLQKVEEELEELRAALSVKNKEAVEGEIGDLLFSMVNLSRFAGVDAESALRRTVEKFLRRFDFVEKGLEREGKSLKHSSLEEMDALWERAKRELE